MCWRYPLGHLPFLRLKQLAINGEIPKKLAKVASPKCAGCLFGAMTKIPWWGKETKSSHEVFVATKPEECVSVDQMTSTELGFVAQLKGKVTKKRYCCATVFVNHYSRLRYVHPQLMICRSKPLPPNAKAPNRHRRSPKTSQVLLLLYLL